MTNDDRFIEDDQSPGAMRYHVTTRLKRPPLNSRESCSKSVPSKSSTLHFQHSLPHVISSLRPSNTSSRTYHPSKTLKVNFMVGALLLASLNHVAGKASKSGLFNATTDHVGVLNGVSELISLVNNSPTPNLMLYYASWCGHCQHYAPTFKTFANNTQHWHNLYRSATIDCGSSQNAEACRKGGANGYPTLSIYNAYHAVKDDENDLKGDFIDKLLNSKRQDKDLRTYVIRHVFTPNKTDDMTSLPWQKSWNQRYNSGNPCPLQPSFETFSSVEDVKSKKKSWDWASTVFIFAADEIDAKTIVLSVGATYRGFSAFHINSTDEKIRIGDDEKFEIDMPKGDVAAPVIALLHEKFPKVPFRPENFDLVKSDSEAVVVEEGKDSERVVGNKAAAVPAATEKAVEGPKPSNDFANMISRMIYVEIPLNYNDGTRQHALRMLRMMHQYSNVFGLSEVETNKLEGILFEEKVSLEQLQKLGFARPSEEWSEKCAGSESKFRGYPCSLWRTFHTLLAACAISESKDCHPELDVIKNYILNFFSCIECVKNFKNELKKFPLSDSMSPRDLVLWIWELHNSVNKRLHGDLTEDPKHPKIQFPAQSDCEECYLDEKNEKLDLDAVWNKDAVYKYLVKLYTGKEPTLADQAIEENEESDTEEGLDVSEDSQEDLSDTDGETVTEVKKGGEYETYESDDGAAIVTKKQVPKWIQQGIDSHDHERDDPKEEETTTEENNEVQGNDAEVDAKEAKNAETVKMKEANWKNLQEKRINHLRKGEKQHQAHEHVSDFAEELEKLGFDEEEIHTRLRNGDIDAVKHEIEVKSRQIESFLIAFKKIATEFKDDQEGFEDAKRRLFHKLNLNDEKTTLESMSQLEKLRFRDPKKLRKYAEKWHDVSHDHSDKPINIGKAYELTGEEMSESHFGTAFILMCVLLAFVVMSKRRVCTSCRHYINERRYSSPYVGKDPEKQF